MARLVLHSGNKWLVYSSGVSVENFRLLSQHKAALVKIIGQNHQFLSVNNAIVSMLAIRGRTAGLRPAAASPALGAFDNPENTKKPDVLRLAEPQPLRIRSPTNSLKVNAYLTKPNSIKPFSVREQ